MACGIYKLGELIIAHLCLINPETAQGGHGDDVIELVSKEAIPGVEEYGSTVKIEFMR